ncbi:hypothetical protein WDU94_015344 [Cyamophila willieti]
MVPSRIRMKMLLIACVIGGVLCMSAKPPSESPEDSDNSIRHAAHGAYTGVRDQSRKAVASTVKHAGKAAPKVIGAVQSAAEFGLNEVGDHAERVDNAIRHSLPRLATRVKDSGYQTAGVAGDHATNQLQRLASGADTLIEAADDVSNTVHQEGTKVIHSKAKLINSGIRFVSTVSNKIDDVAARTLDKAGEIITDPTEHLVYRPAAQLKALGGHLNSFRGRAGRAAGGWLG